MLEAEASNPSQAKARELGVDPLWAPDRKAQTAAAFAAAPRFLLLDFRCAGTLGPVGHFARGSTQKIMRPQLKPHSQVYAACIGYSCGCKVEPCSGQA